MQLQEIVDKLGALKDAATVQRVFGEAEKMGARMIIPVAEVRTCLGVGFGTGKKPAAAGEAEGDRPEGEGGGGGGGAMARPVGVVEVSPEGTQFIPIKIANPVPLILLGLGLGLLLATIGGKCKSRGGSGDKA